MVGNQNDITTAVALKYEKEADPAPRITASGKGAIAEQILAIAKEQGIEIHEDATLVEILSAIEIDSLIPLEAYTAVAEILAYIYRTTSNQSPLFSSQGETNE